MGFDTAHDRAPIFADEWGSRRLAFLAGVTA